MIGKELSAGGIILKKEDNKTLILLIKYPSNTYGFPKGHVEAGENLEDAVRREIKEEIGLDQIEIIKKLGHIDRHSIKKDGTIAEKTILMFLVRFLDNNFSYPAGHDYEWLDIDSAIKLMEHQEDGNFLEKIRDVLLY